MEEVPCLISKKRKRSSSSHQPFMGTFTRSKSRIYLHYNRSGCLRSDSFRFHKYHVNLRSDPNGFKWNKAQIQSDKNKTKKTHESPEADDWSCTLIKDLRSRRVFSLADSGCRLCVDDGEGNEESEKGLNCSSFIVNEDTNEKCFHGEKTVENIGDASQTEEKFKSEEDIGGLSNEDRDSNEERVQATPPDAEIVHMDNNVEHVSVKLTENLEKSEGVQGNNMDKKIINNSALKSAVNSWSRARVFKAPGSLSYRRLLPYLMDQVQDKSCSPKNAKIHNNESQQPSVDELGTGNSNMKVQNRGFQQKDVPVSGDRLPNLTSGNPTPDSSMLFDSITLVGDDQCCSKLTAADANEKIKMLVSCKDKSLEESLSLVENTKIIRCTDDMKPVDSGEIKEDISNSPGNAQVTSEESFQTTPPDADMFVKAVASQNADQVLGKTFNRSTQQNNCCFSDKRMHPSCKGKWGLQPCSQLNLFKTRSSFSYRRMLPYLMEISKHNSGDSRNGKCPKLEKSLHENLVVPSSISDLHGTLAEESSGRSGHMKHATDSSNLQITTLTPLNNLSSSNQLNLIAYDHNTDIPVSVDSREDESHVMVNLSDKKDGLSDTGPGTVNLVPGSCSVTIPTSSLVNLPISGDFNELVSQQVAVTSETDCRTSAVQLVNASKPVEGGSFSHNLSKLELYDPSEVPAGGLAKSILKRLPRGCRGLCTCLNCSSFRLHAERAFEFSKNQMQDAEEIALDLINELSHLRNMLEKATSVSDDNLGVCSNQVKVACRKSSEAEELAKCRLSQMSYDLNIHCRISGGERPRVRFANNVEKRIFHG